MEQILEPEKNVTFLGKKVKGITGSTLKIIAIICMLIDHTAATLLEPYMYQNFNDKIYMLYNILRGIGRLGFPIFCFLLIEGFIYTRSKVKYVIRLGIFALISEVPFDLALFGSLHDNSHQNVFFTLFIGMVVIIIIDKLLSVNSIHKIVRYLLCIAIAFLGMYLAKLLKTDYDMLGVITIVIMCFLRNNKTAEMYGGCMTLTCGTLFEAYAFFALIPTALYNGKRGLRIKYFFYIFYPAHLLILAGIAKLLY